MDMPFTAAEEAEAKRYIDMLLSAHVMGRLGAYKGLLDGEEVIILAYMTENANGRLDSKPLALCYNDTVHRMVEVPHLGSE